MLLGHLRKRLAQSCAPAKLALLFADSMNGFFSLLLLLWTQELLNPIPSCWCNFSRPKLSALSRFRAREDSYPTLTFQFPSSSSTLTQFQTLVHSPASLTVGVFAGGLPLFPRSPCTFLLDTVCLSSSRAVPIKRLIICCTFIHSADVL